MTEHVLDARGLVCPLPVLRASRALRALTAGDELAILVTDQAAPADFARFCETTGHTLIATMARPDGSTAIHIRKAG